MSTDIIQFIPRPKRDDLQTDFPTIAFRSRRERSSIAVRASASPAQGFARPMNRFKQKCIIFDKDLR